MRKNLATIIVLLSLIIFQSHLQAADGESGNNNVTIVAVGDVLFDRGVRSVIERHGAEYLFSGVKRILKEADIAVGNLECPLTDMISPRSGEYVFRCDPGMARVLAGAGFDVMSLANNHALDQGRDGLLDTMENLNAAGIGATGAGRNSQEARKPYIVEKNGLKLAFLSFLEFPIQGVEIVPDLPGVEMADIKTVSSAVAAAKEQSDVVIVSFHWGMEFSSSPMPNQTELARAAVDAGAALVIGHHPHVLQPHEEKDGALIAYSLGNFIFDQSEKGAAESVVLRVTISRGGIENFEFLPVAVKNCISVFVTDEDVKKVYHFGSETPWEIKPGTVLVKLRSDLPADEYIRFIKENLPLTDRHLDFFSGDENIKKYEDYYNKIDNRDSPDHLGLYVFMIDEIYDPKKLIYDIIRNDENDVVEFASPVFEHGKSIMIGTNKLFIKFEESADEKFKNEVFEKYSLEQLETFFTGSILLRSNKKDIFQHHELIEELDGYRLIEYAEPDNMFGSTDTLF